MSKETVKDKIKKLTLDQKKKFIELFNTGSPSTAYTAYLGLSNAEVIEMRNHVDEMNKTIAKEETAKEDKLQKARIEASKYNESVQKTGEVPKGKEAKIKSWEVPSGREREFSIDCKNRSLKFLMEKWCNNKEILQAEIDKYDTKIG